MALEWTALLTIRQADAGGLLPAAVSMLKVRGSELEQALTEFAFAVLGPAGLRYDPHLSLNGADPATVRMQRRGGPAAVRHAP